MWSLFLFSYFKFTLYLFEFMEGDRPTNPEADVLLQLKRNRKGKGRSPRIVFFFPQGSAVLYPAFKR